MTGEPLASWRDARDHVTVAPPVPGPEQEAFYRPIGDLQGSDYARNAFARGTVEELAALLAAVDLAPDAKVLDVGCGDARHLRALRERGVGRALVGVDVSPGLVAAARDQIDRRGVPVDLIVGDARDLPVVLGAAMGTFDVAWSLCQGALGTSPVSDPSVIAGMASAVRPGGSVVITLFHALFAARHLVPGDSFDTVGLVHHQRAEVRGPDHVRGWFDLWTASYTAREAINMIEGQGLVVDDIRGVEPGAYGRRSSGEVGLDDPELLIVAHRPA